MGKIDAKNGLENYCFQMKNTLNDEKLKDKFSDEDKKTIEDCSAEGLQWLEGNQEASAEELEAKQKELEGKFNPIMMKVYQAAGGCRWNARWYARRYARRYAGMPGGMPDMGAGAPG